MFFQSCDFKGAIQIKLIIIRYGSVNRNIHKRVRQSSKKNKIFIFLSRRTGFLVRRCEGNIGEV